MEQTTGVEWPPAPKWIEVLMFDFSKEERNIVREVYDFCPHKAQILVLQIAKRHREAKTLTP
jgi:hypothetical protein